MNTIGHLVAIPLLCLVLAGCAGTQGPGASVSPTPASAGHHHSAPHGGTLVVLGEEFAHLEFVLDPASGTLTAYVLDGEAEESLPLQGGLLQLSLEGGPTLVLEPVADPLTGETKEKSATYRVTSGELKGLQSFNAVLDSIEVKGRAIENVSFKFPQGNDTAHEAPEAPEGHEHPH